MYNTLSSERITELTKAEEEGRAILLPFKLGEKVYVVDTADCESGECPDVDTEICEYSAFYTPTEEVRRCQEAHSHVEETIIDGYEIGIHMDVESNEVQTEVTVNGWLDIADIYKNRKDAETALAKMKTT